MAPSSSLALSYCLGALLASASAGCSANERPDVLIMCHNGNCAGAIDPSRDDTLEALRESLELRYELRPAIDGVEFDFFYVGRDDRCVFAHDFDQAIADAPDAMVAAEEIADYLERNTGPISWNGDRFHIMLELKGQVGTTDELHTPEQADAHAECALEAFEIIEQRAVEYGRSLEVTFYSNNPRVLRALTANVDFPAGRWPSPTGQITIKLGADFSDPTSFSLINFHTLGELTDDIALDTAIVHANWLNQAHYEAFESFGIDLAFWMFSANVEHFAAIDHFDGEYTVTSEALLVRQWAEANRD